MLGKFAASFEGRFPTDVFDKELEGCFEDLREGVARWTSSRRHGGIDLDGLL
jgi:hypothetical protein